MNSIKTIYKMHYFYYWFFLLFFFTTACDPEKYVGYEHEIRANVKSVTVSGTVTNIYMQRSVYNAKVKIGVQQTTTDIIGHFFLQYLLTEDDDYNKPVQIEISAEKFYTLKQIKYFELGHNDFNFNMLYAAPHIDGTALVPDPEDLNRYICQVIVTDYQGIFSISSVIAVFHEEDRVGDIIKNHVPLPMLRPASIYTGYYQCRISKTAGLKPYYYILCMDNEQYCDSLYHEISLNAPDNLLFLP